MPKLVNHIGSVFDKLTVVSRADNSPSGHPRWNCVCECGSKVIRGSNNLVKKDTLIACKSCNASRIKPGNTKHGMRYTKIYSVWSGIVKRTTDPSQEAYKKGYGILGIDPSWLNFPQFYADMGNPPTNQHTIERIDNSKGYFKDNCKWATRTEQARNRGSNTVYTYEGLTLCLSEWCEYKGLKYQRVYDRINKLGWSFEDAITATLQ